MLSATHIMPVLVSLSVVWVAGMQQCMIQNQHEMHKVKTRDYFKNSKYAANNKQF